MSTVHMVSHFFTLPRNLLVLILYIFLGGQMNIATSFMHREQLEGPLNLTPHDRILYTLNTYVAKSAILYAAL
jgi:hypothetical protein